MKKTLTGILAGAALTLCYATSAQASAMLTIAVTGGVATSVSCDNSAAFTATNCGAGFTTVANGANILYTGAALDGVSFTGVAVTGNQATGAAILTDAEFAAMNNNTSARLLSVSFAENNFSLPAGSPIPFNATQGVDNISGPAATGVFTGWGNSANTLLAGPGNGVPSFTPNCVTVASPPTNSCSTNGPVNTFARVGNFALNGIQTVTLAAGQQVNAHASIVTQAVPEPASMLLLGTGLVGLARTARRRQRAR